MELDTYLKSLRKSVFHFLEKVYLVSETLAYSSQIQNNRLMPASLTRETALKVGEV